MKRVSLILVFSILCVLLNAQTPYFFHNYKGERVYLSLNTEFAFVSVSERQLPVDIQQRNIRAGELQSDRSDQKQFQSRSGTSRYYTMFMFDEKMSDEQYLRMLSEMRRQNRDAIIAPFFKAFDGDVIGMSNFFYVKLKEESDTTLLRQMTERTETIIIEQDPFMPLWYVLSITETSEFNAMEYANYFFETGLFQTAEPDLIFNLLQCVHDNMWGLRNIGQSGGTSGIDIRACNAWQISTGQNVTVAVIDHGIDLGHPDLVANILNPTTLSYDTQNRNSPSLVHGNHGIAVAGIVGAARNNSAGIAGVAPNSRLMSISDRLQVNPNDNNFNVLQQQNLAAGINWAWENGADVINL